MEYVAPIFAGLTGFVLLAEVLDIFTVVGFIVIFVGSPSSSSARSATPTLRSETPILSFLDRGDGRGSKIAILGNSVTGTLNAVEGRTEVTVRWEGIPTPIHQADAATG